MEAAQAEGQVWSVNMDLVEEEDEDEGSSFGVGEASSSSSEEEASASLAEGTRSLSRQSNGRVMGRVHIGREFQADVPPLHSRHRGSTPSMGEQVWKGSRAQVPGLASWIESVCLEARVGPHERGRMVEHCLQVLHAWDYDLDGLRANWQRVCQLRPLPAVGEARWSRDDVYSLEQIRHWYQGDRSKMVAVACNALGNHSREEVEERLLWLTGEHAPCKPTLFVPSKAEILAELGSDAAPTPTSGPAAVATVVPLAVAAASSVVSPSPVEPATVASFPAPLPRMSLSAPASLAGSGSSVRPASPFNVAAAAVAGGSPLVKKRKVAVALPLTIFSRIQEHNRSI